MKRFALLPVTQNGALLLLSGTALYLCMQLSALSTDIQHMPTRERLEQVQQQLSEIDVELDRLRQASVMASADYQLSEGAIRKKLNELDQRQAPSVDIQQLQHALATLTAEAERTQAQLQALKVMIEMRPPSGPTKVASPASRKAKRRENSHRPDSLPFNILGLEVRGGESFLALAALNAYRLDDVQLLRPAGSYLGWKLDALTTGEARFKRPDGSSHSLAIK